jgi:hypothetical protein
MKTLVKLLFVAILFSFSHADAFTTDPIKKANKVKNAQGTHIKLLPAKTGFIKVLYVNSDEKRVSVHISGAEASYTDKVRLTAADKGFLKSYDLTSLDDGPYTIKVSDSEMSISYQVEKMEDDRIWAKYWDQFLPQPEPVEPIIALVR